MYTWGFHLASSIVGLSYLNEVGLWRRKDVEVIDMATNVDHVRLFIKYPPKYSISLISKKIKTKKREK